MQVGVTFTPLDVTKKTILRNLIIFLPRQAPLAESATFLVVDTNILLHHFDVLTQFVEDVERLRFPAVTVIPGVVIYELDGCVLLCVGLGSTDIYVIDRQKNRDGLAWFARRASAWLLKKVRERKSVKVQANEETCKPSGNWKSKEVSTLSRPFILVSITGDRILV